MNTYKVTLVFDDSSTTSNLVNATDNESALNTLLNNRMITQQPKFVIFEDVEYVQKEGDFELVRNFKKIDLIDGGSVYTFENRLSDSICVDGISFNLGSILSFKDYL